MKKKVVAIVLVLILIVQTVVMVSAFAEETPDDEILSPTNLDVNIDGDGVRDYIGDDYSVLSSRFSKLNIVACNIISSDNIEFDLYVSDYKKLTGAIKELSGNNSGLYFNLCSDNSKTEKIAYSCFSSKIKKDGWNHIRLSKESFEATENFSFENIVGWFLSFGGDNITDNTNISAEFLKISNICSTIDVIEIIPDAPENINTVLVSEDFSKEYGNNISLKHDNGAFYVNADNADISNADFLEFDVYVGNIEVFKQFTAQAPFYLSLTESTSGGLGGRHADYLITEQITKTGWNHVKFNISNFATRGAGGKSMTFTNVKRIGIHSWTDGAKVCALGTDTIKIANICATVEPPLVLPKEPDNIDKVVSKDGIIKEYGNNISLKQDGGAVYINSENTDLSGSDFLEFDVYVGNIDVFKQYAGKSDFYVSLTESTSGALGSRHADYDFKSQVTKTGWNHIIITIGNFATRGQGGKQMTFTNVNRVALHSWTTGAVSCALGTDKIAVANICGTKIVAPQAPENIDKYISESGFSRDYGNNISLKQDNGANYYNCENIDLSNSDYLEFDVFIGNIEVFKQYTAQAPFYLSITESTSGGLGNRHADYSITEQVTKTGWNHVKFAIGNFATRGQGGKQMTFTNVQRVGIHSWTDGAKACTLGTDNIKVANICGTKIVVPQAPENIDKYISQTGFSREYGNNISLKQDNGANYFNSENTDMSNSDYLEFDVYVGNIEVFKQYTAQAPIYLSLLEATSGGLGNRHADYSITEQVTKTGWNHVKFAIGNFATRGQGGKMMTFTNVQRVGIHSWTDGAKTCSLGSDVIKIANICGTKLVNPDLPENIVANINGSAQNTLGDKYCWTIDRIFVENNKAVDISSAVAIEFDIYVDDYNTLKSSVENAEIDTALQFDLSSANPKDYNGQKPRYFKRNSYRKVLEQITGDGWNHIKFKISNMQSAGNGVFDKSNVFNWSLSYYGKQKELETDNEAKNVFVRVANVCATAELTSVAVDTEKELKVDKTAVYISSAEELADDYGTWNPSAVTVNSKYRTEGKASIQNVFCKQDLLSNQIKYLFNDSANMDDLSVLKFDLFVGVKDTLSNSVKTLSILISSEARANNNYYQWNISTSALKDGWNSVELSLNNAVVSGTPKIKNITSFILKCKDADFGEYDFVDIGIDNLRYLSKTGNVALRVNEEIEEDDDDDLEFDDDLFDDDEELLEEEETEPKVASTVNTKIVKKQIVTQKFDYLTHGIILGIEALVFGLGFVIMVLVDKKIIKFKKISFGRKQK